MDSNDFKSHESFKQRFVISQTSYIQIDPYTTTFDDIVSYWNSECCRTTTFNGGMKLHSKLNARFAYNYNIDDYYLIG